MISEEIFNNLDWRELRTQKEIEAVLVGSVIEDVEGFNADYVDAVGREILGGTLIFIRQSFGVKAIILMHVDTSEDEYQNYFVDYAEIPA